MNFASLPPKSKYVFEGGNLPHNFQLVVHVTSLVGRGLLGQHIALLKFVLPKQNKTYEEISLADVHRNVCATIPKGRRWKITTPTEAAEDIVSDEFV